MRLKRTLGNVSTDCHFKPILARIVGNEIIQFFIIKPISLGTKRFHTISLANFNNFNNLLMGARKIRFIFIDEIKN